MHIVYVTMEFVTDDLFYGGLANFTANMASIFAAHGHKVTVLVVKEDQSGKVEWKKGVTVEYVNWSKSSWVSSIYGILKVDDKSIRDSNFLYGLVTSLKGNVLRSKIKELNKSEKISIIHYPHLNSLGLVRVRRIPYVLRMSSFPGICRLAEFPHFDMKDLESKLTVKEKNELSVVHKAKAIVSPSKITADLVKRACGRKVTVIESPFHLEDIDWNYHIYNNKLKGKKYLLYFGSLCRFKGAEMIADVIYEFLRSYPEFYFVMVGKDNGIKLGKYKKVLAHKHIMENAKEFSDRVIYMSQTEKKNLYPILKHAYGCVFPGRMDNLPNTCIESLGFGKICIGTEGASFEQLITNNYNGYLIERDSKESFIDAIHKLMGLDTETKEEMEQHAKERTAQLSDDNVYGRYLEYYQKQIQLQRKRRK